MSDLYFLFWVGASVATAAFLWAMCGLIAVGIVWYDVFNLGLVVLGGPVSLGVALRRIFGDQE